MQRMIDADALKESIDLQKNRRFNGCTIGQALKTMIDEQPTVDAVPVIRCKDCRFHRGKYCTAWGDGSVAVSCETDADGFCAWAERKETNNDPVD